MESDELGRCFRQGNNQVPVFSSEFILYRNETTSNQAGKIGVQREIDLNFADFSAENRMGVDLDGFKKSQMVEFEF